MLEKLFKRQQSLINYYFDHLDFDAAAKVMEKISECKGTVICTGVGKSGFIANKVAMTFLSTGTKAFYLSALDALHGDIGIVSPDDVFLIFSKSGESDELLSMVPFVRNKGAFLIALSSNEDSRLAKACDFHMFLPLEKELCPFNLAPTTSPAIQLIFGDVLATALMEQKNYSLDQYAMNHPAGRIGKRISTTVKDLMITGDGLPTCSPDDKLVDTFYEFSNKACGCLIVVDKEMSMLGLFTDGDLRRALQEGGQEVLERPMKDLMNPNPKSIAHNVLAWDAMRLMEANQNNPFMVLPVLKEGKIQGIIKLHDIIQSGL